MDPSKPVPASSVHSGNEASLEELAEDIFRVDDHASPPQQPSNNDSGVSKAGSRVESTTDVIPALNHGSSRTRSRKGKKVRSEHKLPNDKQENSRKPGCDDFTQVSVEHFFSLTDNFFALAERLDRADMPELSERLTKVLGEKRKLMLTLSNMVKPHDHYPTPSPDQDIKTCKVDSVGSACKNGDVIGALRKNKSVHWSDEHLGGSIIRGPDVKHVNTIPSPPTTLTNHCHGNNTRGYSINDTESQYSQPLNNNGNLATVSGSDRKQRPPPPYQTYYNFIQPDPDRRVRRRGGTCCDSQEQLCSSGFGHAVECVEEILNEAAVLRREACYMLWRARYLEQLCDIDSIYMK